MQRGRSISGEIEGTFSVLNLVENVLVGQNVESRVRRIEEILLLRSDVRRAFDALNDADPATMKAISDGSRESLPATVGPTSHSIFQTSRRSNLF